MKTSESIVYTLLLKENIYLAIKWEFMLPKLPRKPDSCTIDGWVTCDFTSFSTVFQSYQDNGRLIMKGRVQWSSIYGLIYSGENLRHDHVLKMVNIL